MPINFVVPVTVERNFITQMLVEASAFPIVLLRGTAGSGKSVALRAFLAHAGGPAALYDVGRDARTFARFVRGFAHAVGEVAPGVRMSFGSAYERAMQSSQPQRDLAAWFCEHLRPLDLTIAIDDLHNAAGDPLTELFLGTLIDLAPAGIRWIVSTRDAGALPVPVWMAFRRMAVPVEDRDLAFRRSSVAALANAMHVALDEAGIDELLERTGGWATGVAAALHARRLVHPELTALRSFAPLIDAVLAESDSWELRALLGTLFLPDLSHALLADEAAREAVGRLKMRAPYLFVGPTDAPRYHDRLVDALRVRLDGADARAAHAAVSAAGQVLRRQERFVEALALYVDAEFSDAATQLLEHHGIALVEQGDADVVERALEYLEGSGRALPSPILALRAIAESRLGRFDTAESWFNQALSRAGSDDVRLIEIKYLFACDLMRRDRPDALDLLQVDLEREDLSNELRVAILSARAQALMLVDRAGEARAAIEAVLPRLAEIENDALAARVLTRASYVYLYAGDRDAARRYAQSAAELAARASQFNVATAAYSVLYAIAYDGEDPAAALDSLELLLENGLKAGDLHFHAYYAACAFEIEAERRSLPALSRIDAALRSFDLQYDDGYAHEALLPGQALRASWTGQFDYAYRLLAPTAAQQAGDARATLRWAEIAFYAAAAGRVPEAENAIERAAATLATAEPSNRISRARILLAIAADVLGRNGEAVAFLGEHDAALPARLQAFFGAACALHARSRGERNYERLEAALREMEATGFGGLARMLAALPARAIAA